MIPDPITATFSILLAIKSSSKICYYTGNIKVLLIANELHTEKTMYAIMTFFTKPFNLI